MTKTFGLIGWRELCVGICISGMFLPGRQVAVVHLQSLNNEDVTLVAAADSAARFFQDFIDVVGGLQQLNAATCLKRGRAMYNVAACSVSKPVEPALRPIGVDLTLYRREISRALFSRDERRHIKTAAAIF